MFGGSRRRRPPATPLNSATANPNATTAAASAFMSASNQNPNKALSSAAAAAALRARPHTPTNVAEVQTKRTARRSASASSSGSARFANGHGRLERRGSTASMTERTFRTPSPHRPSTPASQEPQPPVPRIPDGHKNAVVNSRTTGVAMQNFRTASQKMAHEPPSWYGQPAGDVSNVRTSDSVMNTANLPPRDTNTVASQPSRSDSRSSVNFSYPTAFRPQSPPASPASIPISDTKVASPHPSTSAPTSGKGPPSSARARTSQQLVYDPNSRRMVPKAQVEEGVEFQIKQIAEKPSKRRRDGALRREGSQLAKGTVSRVRGTIIDENKSLRELPKREQPAVEVLQTTEEISREEEPGGKTVTAMGIPDPNSPIQSPESRDSSPSTHKPSSEQESNFRSSNHSTQNTVSNVQAELPVHDRSSKNHSQPSQTVRDLLDAMPTRQVLFEGPRPQQPSQTSDHHEMAQESRPSPTIDSSGLPDVQPEQKVIAAENKPIVGLAAERGDLRRSSSNSPARQARFAPGPAEKLAVRHAPLPRSASPIKSAMKQTSPVRRETSPSDNTSDPSGSGAVSPDRKEDSIGTRKKSVRVSFDDQGTIVVGDSAAVVGEDYPVTQSPQGHKRAWFSNIGRSKKKEIALDDDEIMQPRPALPSFGSIREKKIRELGERPLVRPLEPAYSSAVSSSPELRPQSSSTLDDSETTEEPPLGQSSDHAIGALLVQDQTSRNAANISRFREPLPPVVTSIEGSGYSSDSIQGSDSEEHPDSAIEANISSMNSSVLSSQLTQPDLEDSSHNTPTAVDTPSEHGETPQTVTAQQQDVPYISVIQPSPMSVEHSSRANSASTPEYFDVPGGFPDFESELSRDSQVGARKDSVNAAGFESATAAVNSGQAGLLPQTTPSTTTHVAGLDNNSKDESDESDESVYSDAYEDIPDIDSSGFMSLDAIVESPVHEESVPRIPYVSKSTPTPALASESRRDPVSEDGLPGQVRPAPPQDADDWEQAKAFWRSLTAEKRRQLELEAAEEAGAEGDREEVSQPIRRNSSRRKSPGPMEPALQTSLTRGEIIQPESHMRTSVKDDKATKATSAQPQTSMRKTLRTNGGAQSVATPPARQAASTRAQAPKSSMSNRHQATKARPYPSAQPTSSYQVTTQAEPVLQRRGSDASDSSFKRSRPSSSGTLGFRKTMRHEPTVGSGRFSLRSLSPAGSTVRPASNTSFVTSSGGMRRTLRSNSESSREGKRSSVHFPLFARSTKLPPRNSKYTSRFEDSSDEDEGVFTGFRSRLDDSSDDEPSRPTSKREFKSPNKPTFRKSAATAPSISRPTPVLELEEDSPELPDSDDDFMPSPLQSPQSRVAHSDFASHLGTGRRSSGAIGTSTLGRSRSGRGAFTPSSTTPTLPMKDKRGSLLSRLRLSKRADQAGKIQRAELVDSAARRDTKLERDRGQLKHLRGERPLSPKLQKRTSISRSESGGLQRPMSAGHLFGRSTTTGTLERLVTQDKRSFSLGANTNNENYEFENTSVENPSALKKKKFGALRRMFKLDE